MSTKEELLARNRHLNALLENTRATLEEERKINAATKTRIPGGFYLNASFVLKIPYKASIDLC